MSDNITINGNTIARTVQEPDASHSDYILLQTTGEPLNAAQTTQLKDLGVRIHEFVGGPDKQLYLCGYKPSSLDALRHVSFIDYANVYLDGFVVSTSARAAQTSTNVNVLLHHDVADTTALVHKIAAAANVDPAAVSVGPQVLSLEINPSHLNSVAALDEVRVIHPVRKNKLFNSKACEIMNATNLLLGSNKYQGDGQIVAVADTGFDTGDIKDYHKAFSNRVNQLYPWGRTSPAVTNDPDGHGTHVCGSVLGRGLDGSAEGKVEGAAPAAKLVMQSVFSRFAIDADGVIQGSGLEGIPRQNIKPLFQQAYNAGARVHTNSWGSSPGRDEVVRTGIAQYEYNDACEDIDQFVWDNQDMTILFAAGNSGRDFMKTGKVALRSLGSQASSKNCITVGATESDRPTMASPSNPAYTYGAYWPQDFPVEPLSVDHMANNREGMVAFSSRGPTLEDRQKPDVVAPGTAILSTRSSVRDSRQSDSDYGVSKDKQYLYESGTSMATPLVAGCCAVLRESLIKNGYKEKEGNLTRPTGSLVKALLVNGADTIKGQYNEVESNPNNNSGFGRVNLANSIIIPGNKYGGYWTSSLKDTGAETTLPVKLPEQNKSFAFKATLVYADYKGGKLINDLNLAVVAGNKERHGNQVNQEFAVGSSMPFDRLNNVEQVLWPNVPSSGDVKIVVKAYRITIKNANAGPTANDAGQPFAIAWRFLPGARTIKL